MVQPSAVPTWDIFCRVIDNHGDLGVCWRLARGLAERGVHVRLWVDDASALHWMAPGQPLLAGPPTHEGPPLPESQRPGVDVFPFEAAGPAKTGDVVVEAFGCDPPADFVARMATPDRACPPVWINLEYLSAEDYVERSHGLPSPQHGGPGAGLTKWFFYPGFTEKTGGLMRRATSSEFRLSPPDAWHPWLLGHGVQPRPGTRLISLFCYPQAGVAGLLDALDQPSPPTDWPATDLLVTPGHALQAVNHWLTGRGRPPLAAGSAPTAVMSGGHAVLHALPHLAQTDFDTLLQACDLNLIRGEDSLVSALWAGRPFVWHIYPQSDGAHEIKLQAFLSRYLADASPQVRQAAFEAHAFWNAPAGSSARTLLACLSDAVALHARRTADALQRQPDLLTQLMAFAASKRTVPASGKPG